MTTNTTHDIKRQPQGTLISRTIAMPGDTNANGDIFGGWILSMMDLSGGIVARKRSGHRITTVSVDGMSFLNPVQVGNIVSVFGRITHIGRTSMKVSIEVWAERHLENCELCVTEGIFTYVAIDEEGKPVPVPSC